MKAHELIDFIQSRRSVRRFLPESVPIADLERMIEAASWAPSGSNRQNWHFIVVTTEAERKRMTAAVRKRIEELSGKIDSPRAKKDFATYAGNYFAFFDTAPAVIAVVKKPYDSLTERIFNRYNLGSYKSTADVQGPSAAVQNLLLAAHALGYGACWMTGPLVAKEALEKVLGIAAPDELMALIPVGRPAGKNEPPPRKKTDEITTII